MIAIEGCIGSGKSTTARLVAEAMGWNLLLEKTDTHPFLMDFYTDPKKYGIETELSFVLLHYNQLHPLDNAQSIVADFSPAKDLIFARMNLHELDLLLFEHVYKELISKIRMPELVIFLDVPTEELMQRIWRRGRPYEVNVPEAYIRSLRDHYELYMGELGQNTEVIRIVPGMSPGEVAEKVLEIISGSMATRS